MLKPQSASDPRHPMAVVAPPPPPDATASPSHAVAAPAGPHRSGDRRGRVNRLRARAVPLAVGVFDVARGTRDRGGRDRGGPGHSDQSRARQASGGGPSGPGTGDGKDLVCARRRADAAHRLPGSEPLRRRLGRVSAGDAAVGECSCHPSVDVGGRRARGRCGDGRGACAAAGSADQGRRTTSRRRFRPRTVLPDADLLRERCHRAAGRTGQAATAAADVRRQHWQASPLGTHHLAGRYRRTGPVPGNAAAYGGHDAAEQREDLAVHAGAEGWPGRPVPDRGVLGGSTVAGGRAALERRAAGPLLERRAAGPPLEQLAACREAIRRDPPGVRPRGPRRSSGCRRRRSTPKRAVPRRGP